MVMHLCECNANNMRYQTLSLISNRVIYINQLYSLILIIFYLEIKRVNGKMNLNFKYQIALVKLTWVFDFTRSNGMHYSPRYPIGDVSQQRPDDNTHQRNERAARRPPTRRGTTDH